MGKVAEVGAWELEGRTQASVLGGGWAFLGERAGEQGGDQEVCVLGTRPSGS